MRVLLIDFNPYMDAVTPISLGYLAASLRAAGHRAELSSLGASSAFSVRGFAAELREESPRLVGFAAYQRNLPQVRALARLVKQVLPAARVVLGGPQAMFLPDSALADLEEVDHLCRGEGEVALAALVEAIEGGADPAAPIAGITTRLGDGAVVTGAAPSPPSDLDGYPSPWLDGVLDPADWDEAVLLTSRGCPQRCLFCLTPAMFGGGVRGHSLERVLDEIELVVRRGSGRLWFADANFCASSERIVELLEGVLARSLSVEMWIELRAEMVTDELLGLMRRAGVTRLAMGLESASANVLPRLRKGLEPERVGAAALAALAAGIDVELFSQYALPGETRADALATLEFVRGCGVAVRGNTNAQQMQLYFGSEVTARHRELGIRPLRDDLPSYLAIGTAYETEWMPRADIEAVRAAWRAASLDGGRRIVS